MSSLGKRPRDWRKAKRASAEGAVHSGPGWHEHRAFDAKQIKDAALVRGKGGQNLERAVNVR